MNKKSLLKTALVSAAILSGAGLFANSAQAQAATTATHAEQVRGVLQVVDHENQGEVHLFDRDGHVMKQTVKNGKKYKVWEKAYINDELMYRIGTDKQWIPAKYTDWKDAKLGQNVAVTSQKTNSAVNRENYVGVDTINYQGTGNVRLVNSQGSYTSQYVPKNSEWKVWEKADINHEPMYRVGNQSQWVPAKYTTVDQSNTSKQTAEQSTDRVDSFVSNGDTVNTGTTHTSNNANPVVPTQSTKYSEQNTANSDKNHQHNSNTSSNENTDVKPVAPSKPAQPTTPAKPEQPTTSMSNNNQTQISGKITDIYGNPLTAEQIHELFKDDENKKYPALTTNQMEQIFWDKYMAPAGYQKGNIRISDYQVKSGGPDMTEAPDVDEATEKATGNQSVAAYMTLQNYHYVNTDESKNDFLNDTSETANQYGWNDMTYWNDTTHTDNKYQKASIRVTQPSSDVVRMDAIWYN